MTEFCRLPSNVSALIAVSIAFGCSPPVEDTERTPLTFEIPRGGFPDFLATPFPSDLLRRELDGESLLDLRAFPNPGDAAALDDYLALFQYTEGWSTTGAMYFHVEDGIDTGTLPASPKASIAADATMFLIEVDRPTVRIPIEWEYSRDGNSFVPPGTLSVLPMLGARLRSRAALVVTSGVRAETGTKLGPSNDLRALLTCGEIDESDGAPTVAFDCADYVDLAGKLGLEANDLALVQLITPQDPAAELVTAAEHLKSAPSPVVSDLHLISRGEYSEYDMYGGTVEIAQFQVGEPPFYSFDGTTGSMLFDVDGAPITQRMESIDFILTVPSRAPLDARGWPVVVYGHGTGGSLTSAVGEGPRNEAHQLSRAGWAMIAVSEPLHEGRDGYVVGQEQLYTFNLLNPAAGRDNWRQSALEKVQLVSVVQDLRLSAAVTEAAEIAIDGARVGYLGHSQGGIVGAVFVGLEDRIQGAFLSGVGGGFAPSLVDKVEPVNILDVFRTVLQLPRGEEVSYFHPVLTLLQTFIDPADPLNYGDAYRNRPTSRTPHLVATSGLTDEFTPPINHAGFAAAFRLPQVEPIAQPLDVLDVLGIGPVSSQAQGNDVAGDGASLTTGLLQYENEGHFAIYYAPGAQESYRRFFQTLREDDAPVAQVQ